MIYHLSLAALLIAGIASTNLWFMVAFVALLGIYCFLVAQMDVVRVAFMGAANWREVSRMEWVARTIAKHVTFRVCVNANIVAIEFTAFMMPWSRWRVVATEGEALDEITRTYKLIDDTLNKSCKKIPKE